jgi:hypothetical protein
MCTQGEGDGQLAVPVKQMGHQRMTTPFARWPARTTGASDGIAVWPFQSFLGNAMHRRNRRILQVAEPGILEHLGTRFNQTLVKTICRICSS